MTRKQIESVALFLDAIQDAFNSEENKPQQEERTPVHTIKPKMFKAVCKHFGVNGKTIYLLASFALALVKGMAENPSDISAICGGDYKGGNLIVAFEDLKASIK